MLWMNCSWGRNKGGLNVLSLSGQKQSPGSISCLLLLHILAEFTAVTAFNCLYGDDGDTVFQCKLGEKGQFEDSSKLQRTFMVCSMASVVSCFCFHIQKRFPTPSFHSCWWLQISSEALWDSLKVKSVDLIERAFGREWTRQRAHGFKWNCIKARPATLSTGSQCELCWKIYFGELGLSIQGEKTDWCGDINQAMALWWLCKRRFRVHGLKQAILKKKLCGGTAEPGAECCCFCYLFCRRVGEVYPLFLYLLDFINLHAIFFN